MPEDDGSTSEVVAVVFSTFVSWAEIEVDKLQLEEPSCRRRKASTTAAAEDGTAKLGLGRAAS